MFATSDDGYVTLGVLTEDHFWASLCDVLALPDIGRLTFVDRMQRVEELQARIAGAIATRERDELIEAFLASDVPGAPVLDRQEMLRLPHLVDRSVATADPWADAAIGYPVRFAHHGAARTSPPPELDEHRGSGFLPRPDA